MANPWNEIAAKYAEVSGDVRQRFLHPAILQAVRDAPCRRRCLDFGCGPGELTEQLIALCEEVVAIDLAPGFVAAARRRLGSRAMVMENAAFADHPGSFDIIVLSMVITTLQSDQELERLLAMIHKRLDAGGRLIIGTTHPCFTFRALSQVRYANSGAPYKVPIAPGLDVTEYHRPLEQIIKLVAKIGLRIEEAREIDDDPDYYRAAGETPHRFAGQLPMFLVLVCT